MSVYLSQQNSAEQNFELIAKSALPITKEYADALNSRDEQHLVLKDLACKVAIVGLVALGIGAALTVSIAGGVVLASLSLVPIQLSAVVDKQNAAIDTALLKGCMEVADIAREVSGFIVTKRREKVAAIFKHSPLHFAPTRTELKETSNHFAASWDNQTLDPSYKDAMQSHARLRTLAEVVIARTFDADSPLRGVQESCRSFLYGQNESYLTLQWDIAKSQWFAAYV